VFPTKVPVVMIWGLLVLGMPFSNLTCNFIIGTCYDDLGLFIVV